MSKLETIKGITKTLVWLTREELDTMDHKLFRIAAGAITFLAVGAFWYIIFNGTSPL